MHGLLGSPCITQLEDLLGLHGEGYYIWQESKCRIFKAIHRPFSTVLEKTCFDVCIKSPEQHCDL